MKYILSTMIYLICWTYLLINLILERTLKTVSIIILILWHFKFNKEWLNRYSTYDVIAPIFPITQEPIEVKEFKDYFNIKKYFEKYTEVNSPTPYTHCPQPSQDRMYHD